VERLRDKLHKAEAQILAALFRRIMPDNQEAGVRHLMNFAFLFLGC
jgi:hypothetical protein